MQGIHQHRGSFFYTGGEMVIGFIVNKGPQPLGTKQTRPFHQGPVSDQLIFFAECQNNQRRTVFFFDGSTSKLTRMERNMGLPSQPARAGHRAVPQFAQKPMRPGRFRYEWMRGSKFRRVSKKGSGNQREKTQTTRLVKSSYSARNPPSTPRQRTATASWECKDSKWEQTIRKSIMRDSSINCS